MLLITALLLCSDLLITSMRPRPKRKLMPHSQEAMEMFISAGPHTDDDSCSEESVEETGEWNSEEEI